MAECRNCPHPKSLHDTGWDAAGCMAKGCNCQAYTVTAPSARKLLDEMRPSETPSEALTLASRVEKVLALHAKWKDSTGNPCCKECSKIAAEFENWPCPTVRILNGED